jgi:hypothetical protein
VVSWGSAAPSASSASPGFGPRKAHGQSAEHDSKESLRHANTRTLLATYAGLVESERAELRSDLEAAFR